MKNKVIWLTGLPCSGKTTIAKILNKYLPNCIHLDGDDIRNSPISKDLGFSKEDREKNLLRVGFIAKLLYEKGVNVICSFVSPFESVRNKIRETIGDDGEDFLEVFVDCSAWECEQRDVKGMWKKARTGEIKGFTGYNAPYEEPKIPNIICNTEIETVDKSVGKIMQYLNKRTARALYIGRWQAGKNALHEGHKHIIKESLDQGIPVTIAIRDTLPDPKNPLTAIKRKNVIEKYYSKLIKQNMVEVIIIPNIRSVDIGRDLGYKIITHDVPEEMKKISGTKLREKTGTKVEY